MGWAVHNAPWLIEPHRHPSAAELHDPLNHQTLKPHPKSKIRNPQSAIRSPTPMAVPTTRELNVKVIFVVTIVATLLLFAIVQAAQAGFFFFQNQQVEAQYRRGSQQTYQQTGSRQDNLELARLEQQQQRDLTAGDPRPLMDADGNPTGEAQRMPIDQAMRQIADRYAQ